MIILLDFFFLREWEGERSEGEGKRNNLHQALGPAQSWVQGSISQPLDHDLAEIESGA